MNLKTTLSSVLLVCCMSVSVQAQYELKPEKGYTQNIGTTVFMLENLKTRITKNVQKLTPAQTDYLLVPDANRIGAMIYHLAATEKYYQVYTLENRELTEAETAQWGVALELGDPARTTLVGKPITYYLDLWDGVRKETLRLLKTKDDKWFDTMIKDNDMNNYFAWFHVMEHQSNHMGQIQMIKNRLPKE